MTRAEKVAEAQQLRAQGLLMREIGERLGIAVQTVNDYLHDPDLAQLKARKESYRGECVNCGAPTDGSGGPSKASKRCARCQIAELNALNIQRGRAHQALVERLWAEGKTCREIADLLGWEGTYRKHGISRLRQLGYNLPHRYSPERVANQTAANRAMVTRREARKAAA